MVVRQPLTPLSTSTPFEDRESRSLDLEHYEPRCVSCHRKHDGTQVLAGNGLRMDRSQQGASGCSCVGMKQMTDIKPTSFKNVVPKAERNGMFSGEDSGACKNQSPVVGQSGAMSDVRHPACDARRDRGRDLPGRVARAHIEPLFDGQLSDAAEAIREEAYKARTGAEALDLSRS